jgi:hypothetical protein
MTLHQTTFRHLTPVTGAIPYTELTADLERATVYHAVTDDQFYLAVGQYLEPDALRDQPAQRLLESARQLVAQGVPLSPTVTLAQAYQRVHARQLTPEQHAELEGWMARAEPTAKATQAQACADFLAPLLQRRIRTALIQQLATANLTADQARLDDLADQLSRVRNVGRPAAHSWSGLDPGMWELFARLRRAERASTGLRELDDVLDGGPPRGTLTTWGGDPGDGKSVALVSQLVANVRNYGRRCVYLTSEMGVGQTLLRVVACMTGETQAAVAAGGDRVQAKLAKLLARPTMGSFAIAFLPSGSTVPVLERALQELAQRDPRFTHGWDQLYVDYGDLMAGGPNDRSSYEEGRTIWRGLRKLAEESTDHEARWVVTASQLKDPSDRNGGPNDLADSKHKGRISDGVLLIDRDKECLDDRYVKVAKYRDGRNGDRIGPFTPDFARSQFAGQPFSGGLDA